MSFREQCGYFHASASRPLRETGERWCGQPHRPPHYGTPVTVTEDPPMQGRSESPTAPASAAAWWWLVTVSVVLLLVAAGTLAVWWAASRETRTTSYRVLGDLSGIRLDLGDADVEIDGGAAAVEVRRIDRFAFGAPSREKRSVTDGTLMITSRCPDQVLGSCRASYRLAV